MASTPSPIPRRHPSALAAFHGHEDDDDRMRPRSDDEPAGPAETARATPRAAGVWRSLAVLYFLAPKR